MMNITVLGCGSSGGVPMIGCDCPVCTSANPKNKRSRVSVLVEAPEATVLIDTSPDLRTQSIANNFRKIDALIYTHAHADHLHGIDDLRAFNAWGDAPIDTYGDKATLKSIEERFGYVFLPPKPFKFGWYRPCLTPHVIEAYRPFSIKGLEIVPFEQQHGQSTTLGFRIGNFAYSTDTNGLSEDAMKILAGVDTWVVDCLRYTPAPTHAHLAMTLDWIAHVKPRQAYLSHMGHEFEYERLASELPAGVSPAYDGLKLVID